MAIIRFTVGAVAGAISRPHTDALQPSCFCCPHALSGPPHQQWGDTQWVGCASAWGSLLAAWALVLTQEVGQGCTAPPATAQAWVGVEWWRSWTTGDHPLHSISSCGLTNRFTSHKSAVTLGEVMVGLQLWPAGLPHVPKDEPSPSSTALLHIAWWGCSHPWCQQGYLGWWPWDVGWAPRGVPVFVWHCSQAAWVHWCLHCWPVQLAGGLWASPDLFQHFSWMLPKHPDALLYLFLCICWIVRWKICFTTAETV